ADLAAVVGVAHRTSAARDHEGGGRRAHVGHRGALERAERRLAVGDEDLGHGTPRVHLDDVVDVHERAAEPFRAARADGRLAGTHEADEHEVPRLTVAPCHRSESRYARWLRAISFTESPPNLRSASEARTSATIVSATTPEAGTAVTSVRSLNETVSSLVSTFTVRSTGLLRVASGFIATRATRSAPVVMPPSVPPARVLPRVYSVESASHRISSWASLPRRPATSKPSPISTPFIAWMLMRACASRPSILRSQCTWLPSPGGTP